MKSKIAIGAFVIIKPKLPSNPYVEWWVWGWCMVLTFILGGFAGALLVA